MPKREKCTPTERARKGGYARAQKLGPRKLREVAIRMNAIRWTRQRAARVAVDQKVTHDGVPLIPTPDSRPTV